MRIAIANRISSHVGGAEEYLARVAPMLGNRGNELSFFFEHSTSGGSLSPATAAKWAVDAMGAEKALRALRDWKPDVVYCNGLDTPALELALAGVTASVYSAHAYYGTCISGRKMHSFPRPRVCERRFGPACLGIYLPRRCGGLSPISMLTAYRTQSSRLAAIRAYSAVIVHSQYMKNEYARNGIETTIVPLPPPPSPAGRASSPKPDEERRLVFLGRLFDLKGCGTLIDAAVRAARALPSVRVTVAGEGPERASLERHAAAIAPAARNLSIRFVGAVDRSQRDALLADAHALIVPSLWPEPVGMVGLEAAAFGVPAVAFRVGGVPEWLEDGKSGYLAPCEPPFFQPLSDAIVRAVRDPEKHAALSAGARRAYERFAAHDVARQVEELCVRTRSSWTQRFASGPPAP